MTGALVGGTAMRAPAVAGRFYPAPAGELAATVDALLAEAAAGDDAARAPGPPPPPGRPVRALVVPHAGYIYSGPVAARGYAWAGGDLATSDRVVLLGPSHYVALRGMACAAAARWRTPLGEVAVERAPGVPADDRPHAAEHALEVQLPFLQRLINGRFSIVPIAVGVTEPGEVADLLDVLAATRPAMVVVSTDLSHYHDAATATRRDTRTSAAVVARDVGAIGPEDACGSWALRGLLEHCLRHGRSVHLLDRRTSADTAGDPDRVVGYGSFVVTDVTDVEGC